MTTERLIPHPTTDDHSYEAFSRREFYREIDRQTVLLAPQSSRVLDVATGTGAMLELLIEENKLLQGGSVLGIDIDSTAVEAAEKKFSSPQFDHYDFRFLPGRSEEIPLENSSVELAVFGNAIHLTEVPESLAEVSRVLMPGGTLIVSSAYVKDVAYNEEARERWGKLLVTSMLKARKQGWTTEKPDDLFNYTLNDYETMTKEAGFSQVETFIVPAQMNKDDVLAICNYDGFAQGALPRVPVANARQILTESAKELFDNRYKENPYFPRNWMLMRATK